jgi:DNA-binding NtrC family response regulator
VLAPSREIGVDLIPEQVRFNREFRSADFVVPPEGIPLREVLSNAERKWIESALEAAGGVQKKAAELLFIKPTTLNEMIKRYDIRPRRRRADDGDEPAG